MPDVVLKETTLVRVGKAKVGCGNLWERAYTLPDGSTTRGMSARVAIGDVVIDVGVGSELCIDGVRYRVTGIDKEPGALGRVRLATMR